MKKIVAHDSEILLPKCMYTVKSRTNLILTAEDESNINISNQVIKFLKVFVTELFKAYPNTYECKLTVIICTLYHICIITPIFSL